MSTVRINADGKTLEFKSASTPATKDSDARIDIGGTIFSKVHLGDNKYAYVDWSKSKEITPEQLKQEQIAQQGEQLSWGAGPQGKPKSGDFELSWSERLGAAAKGITDPFKKMFSSWSSGLIAGGLIVGMTAACIAFPPFAGVMAGLTPWLAGLGMATGAAQFGYGCYKASNATTEAEAKKGWENIGAGIFTFATSAFSWWQSAKAANAATTTTKTLADNVDDVTRAATNVADKADDVASAAGKGKDLIDVTVKPGLLDSVKAKFTGVKLPKIPNAIAAAKDHQQAIANLTNGVDKIDDTLGILEKGSKVMLQTGKTVYSDGSKLASVSFIAADGTNKSYGVLKTTKEATKIFEQATRLGKIGKAKTVLAQLKNIASQLEPGATGLGQLTDTIAKMETAIKTANTVFKPASTFTAIKTTTATGYRAWVTGHGAINTDIEDAYANYQYKEPQKIYQLQN